MKEVLPDLRPVDLEFIQAAADGDLTKVKACLSAGANLHAKADTDQLRSGVNLLSTKEPGQLRSDVNLLSTKEPGQEPFSTAFMHAAFRDRVEVCVALFLEGSDPKEVNSLGENLTHLAQDTRNHRLMLAAAAMGVSQSAGAATTYRTAGLREAASQKPLKAAVNLNIPALVLEVLERDPTISDAEVKRGIASATKGGPTRQPVIVMLRSWLARKQAASVVADLNTFNRGNSTQGPSP